MMISLGYIIDKSNTDTIFMRQFWSACDKHLTTCLSATVVHLACVSVILWDKQTVNCAVKVWEWLTVWRIQNDRKTWMVNCKYWWTKFYILFIERDISLVISPVIHSSGTLIVILFNHSINKKYSLEIFQSWLKWWTHPLTLLAVGPRSSRP